MPKPSTNTYPEYFTKYVNQVPENELEIAFANQLPIIKNFLTGISEEKSFYAYDKGKWTLKELLQHLIDTERVFNYRALSFARKDKASLPGFDENEYAQSSNANSRIWLELVEEFIQVRKSTELLFKSFSEEMLASSGLANNKVSSVLSMGFIIIGHFYHHKKIIEERYL